MNVAGMVFALTQIFNALGMPHFQSLVTDGSVSQSEFVGTRNNLGAVLKTLKKAPPDKLEAMVRKYDEQLTEQLNKFDAQWGKDTLGDFRDARIMEGYVTMIMSKSGLKG